MSQPMLKNVIEWQSKMDEKLLAPSRIADYHYHFQKAGVVDALDVSHQVRSLAQFLLIA